MCIILALGTSTWVIFQRRLWQIGTAFCFRRRYRALTTTSCCLGSQSTLFGRGLLQCYTTYKGSTLLQCPLGKVNGISLHPNSHYIKVHCVCANYHAERPENPTLSAICHFKNPLNIILHNKCANATILQWITQLIIIVSPIANHHLLLCFCCKGNWWTQNLQHFTWYIIKIWCYEKKNYLHIKVRISVHHLDCTTDTCFSSGFLLSTEIIRWQSKECVC